MEESSDDRWRATARFSVTKEYFAEAYLESIAVGPRFRRWRPELATAALASGVVLIVLRPSGSLLGIALVAVGLAQWASLFIYRWWWMRARTSAPTFGQPVRYDFDDEGFDASGPHSSSRIEWGAIQRALTTPKGLFLWPERGVFVYLPSGAFDSPEAPARIVDHWARRAGSEADS